MTAAIERAARAYADPELDVVCRSTPGAPRFIETYKDALAAAPGMTQIVREHEADVDAFVVACHSDINLDALKELSEHPVVGIGEASMKIASMLGHRFAVVSTTRHSIPGKRVLARKYHLEGVMVSVRAPAEATSNLSDEETFMRLARSAIEEDLAEVIVLGCAGLAGLDRRLQAALGVPVLDGVVCALIVATGLVRYGVSTSKVLGYGEP
jgi:allantoin racemase